MDIRTILKNLKIEELNAMQQAAVDAYKEGNDIVLLSPTGSGRKNPGLSYSTCAVTEEGCRGSAGCSACSVTRVGIADRTGLQRNGY